MPDFFSICVFGSISYVLLSWILFLYPNLLRKKKNYLSVKLNLLVNSDKVLHISHRGGSREGLENTLETFEKALEIGSDMLEMDVCLTKDEEIVVVHDPCLDRLCGFNVQVANVKYENLPPFADRILLHFSEGQYFETKEAKTKYMPKLEEVFQKFPDKLINVELKNPTPILITKTETLIRKYNREHLTIWGTRGIVNTKELLQLNKNIPVFFSAERLLLTYLYYLTGLLPFVNIKENSMQLPLCTKEFKNWKIKTAEKGINLWKTKLGFVALNLLNKCSAPLFRHLKKRGILVFYWVLNDKGDYQRAANSGASGIMTDSPKLLKLFLRETGRGIENFKN